MSETIDHPTHYNPGSIEAIDVIDDWRLGFNMGSVLKYVVRAGKKPGVRLTEDLAKAQWYLSRELEHPQRLASPFPGAQSMEAVHFTPEILLRDWQLGLFVMAALVSIFGYTMNGSKNHLAQTAAAIDRLIEAARQGVSGSGDLR